MSARVLLCIGIALASAVAALFACVDVTPIYVAPRDAGFLAEASCTVCLEDPSGCDDTIEKCRVDPRCAPVLGCVEQTHCFDRPTLDDKLTCGLPCAVEGGITSTNDPTIQYLLDVIKCGQTKCAIACNLGDGGATQDAL
jgi:hypothetical protein